MYKIFIINYKKIVLPLIWMKKPLTTLKTKKNVKISHISEWQTMIQRSSKQSKEQWMNALAALGPN